MAAILKLNFKNVTKNFAVIAAAFRSRSGPRDLNIYLKQSRFSLCVTHYIII